jgi:hypothetical protein
LGVHNSTSYRCEFEDFKEALQHTSALYYPNYEAEWFLRTDASEYGMGAVLLQKIMIEGEEVLQPIAFVSHKFSEQATRWSTIEQEAFEIFYAVQKLSYYLMGKEFIIETDHNNLLWMEASTAPKIIRWRIYLQSFQFKIKHIAGKRNLVADWLSRLYEEEITPIELSSLYYLNSEDVKEVSDSLRLTLLAISLRPRKDTQKSWDKGVTKVDKPTRKKSKVKEITKLIEQTPMVQVDDSAKISDTQEISNPVEEYNISPVEMTQLEAFQQVHNAKVGHVDVRLTWSRINQ